MGKFFCRCFGPFIGMCIYIPLCMICFAGVIKYLQGVVKKSPYHNLALFHTLEKSQRQRLIDVVEMASFSYVNDVTTAHERLSSLRSKGYEIFETPHINDGGLTYVTLTKGNEIFVVFRGSTTTGDFLDDLQLLTSGDNVEHMGRFVVGNNAVTKILKENPQKNVVVIGHSLGGSVVQYVILHNPSSRLTGYTINPFGMPGKTHGHSIRITDIIHEADVAQLVMLDNRLAGESSIMVRGVFKKSITGEWVPTFDLTSTVQQHSIDNLFNNMLSQHEGLYVPPNNSELNLLESNLNITDLDKQNNTSRFNRSKNTL